MIGTLNPDLAGQAVNLDPDDRPWLRAIHRIHGDGRPDCVAVSEQPAADGTLDGPDMPVSTPVGLTGTERDSTGTDSLGPTGSGFRFVPTPAGLTGTDRDTTGTDLVGPTGSVVTEADAERGIPCPNAERGIPCPTPGCGGVHGVYLTQHGHGVIRRRRVCGRCGIRFSTSERAVGGIGPAALRQAQHPEGITPRRGDR